jgi:uncharacterized protein (DUF58 family)
VAVVAGDILARVRRIEILARRRVDSAFSGEYESWFKGRGMSFDEVRPYQNGDDIRSIDWNVTARTGTLHVKKFVEERELTVILMVDMSSSGAFGTRRRLKSDLAVELAALLSLTAVRNNDRVGLMTFTSEVERFVPPKKGKSHVLRLVRDLVAFEPRHTRTGLADALAYLNRAVKRRAVVFLISDFMADPASFEKPLAVANRRHDLVALQVADPAEERIPSAGWTILDDAETGERVLADTGSKRLRSLFAGYASQRDKAMERMFRRLDADRLVLRTSEDYAGPLIGFFRRRRGAGR